MTPEDQLMVAMKRAENFNAMTISVVLVEIHRINETTGLSEAEMEVFAKRLNDLADSIESFNDMGK